jgi:hypothetical protein
MGILETAISTGNWEVAAHMIVYAAAKILIEGERPDGRKTGKKAEPQS